MRRPARLAARVLPTRRSTSRELERAPDMTGTKVERVHHHGVGALERFVVGRVLERRAAPRRRPAEACAGRRRRRREPAQIVCGAPNVAAGQTVAVARPGAVMPDGTKLERGEAARRRVSEGMILAEDELGDRHRPRRDPGARRATAPAGPGTPLADVLPIATDVLELEITPNRPDCLGVYGVAREVHAATGAALAPAAVGATDPGSAGAVDGAEVRRRVPRPVPALHRARVRGRDDRPVAAVAEGAADGRRAAPDQQRRRHHQLRDAADRPAAARLRPRPRRRRAARRAPRARRRGGRRRSTAQTRTLDAEMVRDRRRRRARRRSPA